MASTKECKAELRGHEHVVEAVAWAPDIALPHIADACGMEVHILCFHFVQLLISLLAFFLCRRLREVPLPAPSLSQALEIKQ